MLERDGLNTYLEVRSNNHLSDLRRKMELENLRKGLELIDTDFKTVDDRTKKEKSIVQFFKMSLGRLNTFSDKDLNELINTFENLFSEKEKIA